MKLNESELRSYIRNRVLSLITEEGEAVPVSDVASGERGGMGYSIEKFCSDAELKGYGWSIIPRFTAHLQGLEAMCQKHNIDFEWNISRVEGANATESGWKITANAAMPELKVAGYTYVGSVVPMTDNYALVVPSKEFKDNLEVLERIKATVAKEKCAGCNRVAERGIYYVFREDATGELKKYGATCARKYLGISVEHTIGKIFSYLYGTMMTSFEEDEDEWGRRIGGKRTDWRPTGYNQVAAACAYLALFGIPETRFSFKYCQEYDQLENYYSTIDEEHPVYPPFFEEMTKNMVKIDSFTTSFYSGVRDFCEKMVTQPGTFDEMVKANGLHLSGIGGATRLAARRFNQAIYPYVVLKFFQSKRDEGVEVTAVEEFYGTKEFTATILNKEEKKRLEGGTYLQVYAKTENNEYLTWYQKADSEAIGIAKQVILYGEYNGENGKYCVLRNVRIMDEAAQQARAERAAVVYPEDGTRLRSVMMTVVKSAARYEILRSEDGCEYFVSNTRKDRYGNVLGLVVSEWAQIFKPGAQIRLTGTVDSYTDRYGETKHTLKRVSFDETTFSEIDWSQYSFDELVNDKKKLPVDGGYVDISWFRPCDIETAENYLIAQLLTGEHVVYNKDNATIEATFDEYDDAEEYVQKKADEALANATWEEMRKDRLAVYYNTESGRYEATPIIPLEDNPGLCEKLGQYIRKGNIHLVLIPSTGDCWYYDATNHCFVGMLISIEDVRDAGEALVNAYNSLPESSVVQISESEIRGMVAESIRRVLKKVLGPQGTGRR